MQVMQVRKLNSCGISKFSDFIEDCRSGGKQDIPLCLLTDDKSSKSIAINLRVVDKKFVSRFEIGAYLKKVFEGAKIQQLIGDRGFWSWFALLWFDQLCPVSNDGQREVAKEYNFILSKNHWHRPRHAIYISWQLVNRYDEDVKFMLNREPKIRGELTEQMMSRQQFLFSEAVIRLASMLYYDSNRASGYKRGAAGRDSAGCIARYISWLQQIEVTYDIFSISKEELQELLPSEFDRFRSN